MAACCGFDSLPPPLVQLVLALLPADARLQAAAVCRAWRAALRDNSLWTRLDLSPAAGLARAATDKLLRAAAARCGGGLKALDASHCPRVRRSAVRDVITANAATLRELRICNGVLATEPRGLSHQRLFDPEGVEELVAFCSCAPMLRALHADVKANPRQQQRVRSMLRNEPPFGSVRVRHCSVATLSPRHDQWPVLLPRATREAGLLAFLADAAAHASLQSLLVERQPLDTAAALDAVVDTALARRLPSLYLLDCRLSRASVPALVRLLQGDTLTQLHITLGYRHGIDWIGPPTATVLGAALRASSTLTDLALPAVVQRSPGATTALLGALTGHPRLRVLRLTGPHDMMDGSFYPSEAAATAAVDATGAALGALVAANAPALTELHLVDAWGLRTAELGPLFDALPANTHLRRLQCTYDYRHIGVELVRDRLLPALRANTSLHSLVLLENVACAHAREAVALVNARAAAAARA
jgi:hypothetical protein